jgi:hypothetical protein
MYDDKRCDKDGESSFVLNLSSVKRVQLTLDNCILPAHLLDSTPSSLDGLNSEDEYELRVMGCELIQSSGILLRIPQVLDEFQCRPHHSNLTQLEHFFNQFLFHGTVQVAMATGQVLFHRFYYCKSFVRYPPEITAMACVALASKIEEEPRRMRDVISVCHHLKQLQNGETVQPMLVDSSYAVLKDQVIRAERRILKELGFCVHIKHPHKVRKSSHSILFACPFTPSFVPIQFIVTLLTVLEKEENRLLMQTAW